MAPSISTHNHTNHNDSYTERRTTMALRAKNMVKAVRRVVIPAVTVTGLAVSIASAAPGDSLTGEIHIHDNQATKINVDGGRKGGGKLLGIIKGGGQKGNPNADVVIQGVLAEGVPSNAKITIGGNKVEDISNNGASLTLQGVRAR
jgi:hypothetical protein